MGKSIKVQAIGDELVVVLTDHCKRLGVKDGDELIVVRRPGGIELMPWREGQGAPRAVVREVKKSERQASARPRLVVVGEDEPDSADSAPTARRPRWSLPGRKNRPRRNG